MNKYTVRVFDGQYTSIYTTEALNGLEAENKIASYHKALGGTVEKITATQRTLRSF